MSLWRREWGEHFTDLLAGAQIQCLEAGASCWSEGDEILATIGFRGMTANQLRGGEGAENAAEIAKVKVEMGGDLGGCGLRTIGEFVEDTRFGEGESAMEQVFVQRAEEVSIKAAEPADGSDLSFRDGQGHFLILDIVNQFIDFVKYLSGDATVWM
jgi:hypothetical protein